MTLARRRLAGVIQTDPHEQIERKLIKAPRRVWKAIERQAAEERRTTSAQAAIVLERAIAAAAAEAEREQVA